MRGAVIPWLLVAGVAAGCFGSEPAPVMQFYRIPIWEGVRRAPRPAAPVVLQVEALDVLPAYDRQRIVYRVSEVQLRNYRLRQWVVKPGRLLRESLQRYFQATGLFQEVTAGPRPIPDYVLRGLVITLEQVERQRGKRWFAALDLELGIYRASDGRRVWAARLQGEAPVSRRHPEAVVTALTRLLRARLDARLAEIVKRIQQDREARAEQAPRPRSGNATP